MASNKEKKLSQWLWLDLEMTGLDVEKEVIIEVAAVITDLNFNCKAQYETVVKQPQKYIDSMDEWNKKHHTQSGLLAKISQGKPPEQVEEEMLHWVNENYETDEGVVLAGNSIGQDRKFIDKYMIKLSQRLHYRMLDVTSWKLIFKNQYNIEYQKKNAHRALDDINESIEEMKCYLSYLNKDLLKS